MQKGFPSRLLVLGGKRALRLGAPGPVFVQVLQNNAAAGKTGLLPPLAWPEGPCVPPSSLSPGWVSGALAQSHAAHVCHHGGFFFFLNLSVSVLSHSFRGREATASWRRAWGFGEFQAGTEHELTYPDPPTTAQSHSMPQYSAAGCNPAQAPGSLAVPCVHLAQGDSSCQTTKPLLQGSRPAPNLAEAEHRGGKAAVEPTQTSMLGGRGFLGDLHLRDGEVSKQH